jgi:hypothetical protein
MGQGRAGLYSYDWLENLVGCDLHSSDKIVPEYQELTVGDAIRLVRPDYRVDLRFEVAEIRPAYALVLRTPGDSMSNLEAGLPNASWVFVLENEGRDRTRLLVRWRSDYADTALSRFFNGWGIEVPHFLMERKMMLGIKERAEREGQAELPPEPPVP